MKRYIPINVGGMRYKIDFYTINSARDEYSGYTENYVYSFTTWSDIVYLGGNEQIINAQIFPAGSIRFQIRYRKGIDETMRILFQDKFYNITNIDVDRYRSLKITASLVSE